MSRIVIFQFIFLFMGLFVGAGSFAAGAGERPCRDDIQKFCKGIKVGGGALVKCLHEHEAQLSSGCRAQGEKMKAAYQAFRQACKDDAAKLCKDAKQPGHEGVLRCLKTHEAELSAPCKTAMHPDAGHHQD